MCRALVLKEKEVFEFGMSSTNRRNGTGLCSDQYLVEMKESFHAGLNWKMARKFRISL
jgi:hypothetical protein